MNFLQINTAVKFLINPNIQKASVDAKRFFLKKKGLTEDEIQTAFSRASTMSSQPPVSESPESKIPTFSTSTSIQVKAL